MNTPLTLLLILLALVTTLSAFAAQPPGVRDLPSVDEWPSVKDLPNPFIFNDGSSVKTKEDWGKRRNELKAFIQYYQYGHLPPASPVRANPQLDPRQNESLYGKGVTQRMIVLTMGPENKVSTIVLLTTPPGNGPFPVIVRGDLGWGKLSDDIVKQALGRGYALAEFDRTLIAPDKKDVRTGIYEAYPDWDPSALAAWAWGFSRVIDYVETLPNIDKSKIIATGHSRGGKAVLLAGAMDERIALTVPNNSGCGGAGCYRFQADKSEDIAAITKNFPHWFHPRFRDFIGKVDQLPIDQHHLKALVAPRALLTTEALGDLWANPQGTQLTHAAARHVYDFLGAPDRIGIYFREGKHEHNADDWVVLMDFADKTLRGKPTDRDFSKLAFPGAPEAFKWSAPKP